MGGLAALLMMTTVGLNYGWRPDNQGGVEYLVQIPPDQLDEMQRLGEVTSVIDPAVRGRVSKVIISVGEVALPRELPPDLAMIDAPESLERVLKPQSPGQGLSLPSLPSSLGQQASGAQTPGAGASTGIQYRGAGPTAATASPTPSGPSFSPPSFGAPSATGAGTARPGTGMSASLANQIQEELGATANQAAAAGENAFSAGVDAINRAGSDAIGRAGNGLRESINGAFGGQQQQQPTPRTPSLQFTTGDPNFARSRANGPTTDPVSRDNNWNGLSNRRFTPGATQTNQASPASPASVSSAAPNNSFGGFGQPPSGMTLPTNNRTANAAAFTNETPRGPEVENPFSNRASNPVLTSNPTGQPTYPPGTWSLDAYGRPVNRMGQLLDANGQIIPAVASSVPNAPRPEAPQAAPAQMPTRPTFASAAEPASSSNLDRYRPDGRGSFSPQGPAAPIEGSRNQPPVVRSPKSSVGESSKGVSRDGDERDEVQRSNQSIAAQPLFNGLLLISLVVNVYLINWLQKLRHRFRELVTAKRSGNAAPSN